MFFIDTHTHLFSNSFDSDRHQVVEQAIRTGVEKMLLPNIDRDTIQAMLDLADTYPENCLPMLGLHPGSVEADFREQLAEHRAWFDRRQFYAVGEIGLDLYWRQDNLVQQQEAFMTQIGWALDLDLPVVIHSRESCTLILDMLGDLPVKGVFHCFTGTAEEATRITDRGMYVGLGGVITYKANEALRSVVKNIPLDHIVLETDSPYLAPVPFRGKRNESSYLPVVAETLCTLFGKGLDEIAALTTANAQKLFRL